MTVIGIASEIIIKPFKEIDISSKYAIKSFILLETAYDVVSTIKFAISILFNVNNKSAGSMLHKRVPKIKPCGFMPRNSISWHKLYKSFT